MTYQEKEVMFIFSIISILWRLPNVPHKILGTGLVQQPLNSNEVQLVITHYYLLYYIVILTIIKYYYAIYYYAIITL